MSSELTDVHKKENIHEVFNEISPTYDLVNQVLSFGLDRLWRNRLARCLSTLKNYDLLDLATGTGDQIFSILKKNPFASKVIGLDSSKNMLSFAKKKSQKKAIYSQAEFVEGDALNLEFAPQSFDVISMSFGIRNVSDIHQCFLECHKALRSHGKLYILEFSMPKNSLLRWLHLFYLRKILPKVGGFISKKPSAYHYLNQTIESFPYGEALAEKIKSAGFNKVNCYPLTFGISTLYEAIK